MCVQLLFLMFLFQMVQRMLLIHGISLVFQLGLLKSLCLGGHCRQGP